MAAWYGVATSPSLLGRGGGDGRRGRRYGSDSRSAVASKVVGVIGCWRFLGKEICRPCRACGHGLGEGSVSRVCGVGGFRGSVMATTAMRLVFALGSNPGLSSFLGQPLAWGLNAVGVGRTRARAVALAARVGIGIGIAIGIENAEEHWVCSRTRTRTPSRTRTRTRSRSGPPWNCHGQEGGWELVSGDWDLVTRRVGARGLQRELPEPRGQSPASGVWKLASGNFPCAAWGHAAFKGSCQFPGCGKLPQRGVGVGA